MSSSITPTVGRVDINGVAHAFVPIGSLGVRAAFEDWMVGRAYEKLKSTRKHMTAQEYTEERDGLRRDITAHLYTWGTSIWESFYQTEAGQKQLLHLMFQLADPKYDVSVVDQIWVMEDPKEILRHMFTWGQDPKPNGTTG